MKKEVGLWIDHKKTVIVTLKDKGQEIKLISSHLERDAQPSGGWSAHSGKDYGEIDRQDRHFMGHLDIYYDEVISFIHNAESILIFGPGEAKGELKKRIESKGLPGRIVAVETVDEMTEPQIAAKVRMHFLK
jgi:stalled ribosome rescue protein Dom34